MRGRPRAFLAVFAQPDDETFRCGGTLALLARRDVQVQSLTATGGVAAAPAATLRCARAKSCPTCARRSWAARAGRWASKRRACSDYRDGTLHDVDEQEGMAHVLDVIRELRPQVLITWPPDGLSGHPDHVAVSRWTRLAFEAAHDLGPEAPLTLGHMVVLETVADALRFSGLHAVADEDVTLTVDVAPIWEEKLSAIRCHRTQAGAREEHHILEDYLTQKTRNRERRTTTNDQRD